MLTAYPGALDIIILHDKVSIRLPICRNGPTPKEGIMTDTRAPVDRTQTLRIEVVSPPVTSAPIVASTVSSSQNPWHILGWIAVGIVVLIVFLSLLGALGRVFSGPGTTIPYMQNDTIGTASCRLSDGRKGKIGYRNGQARCYAVGG